MRGGGRGQAMSEGFESRSEMAGGGGGEGDGGERSGIPLD